MVNHTVACQSGADPYRTTSRALQMLSLDDVLSKGDTVAIKPNLCINKSASTGLTTHPEVVEAIIDWLKNRTSNISIVESNVSALSLTPETNFRDCGYTELSRRRGVKLVNLSEDQQSQIHIDQGLAGKTWKISRTLLDSDVIVNVPVLKTNNLTAVTLGLKNLYGLWGGNKWTFHDDLWDVIDRKTLQVNRMIDNAIVDLYSIFKSKLGLTVLDAIVGSDGYFGVTMEHPRNANLICAGFDLFSVDRVAAELIGVDPTRLAYLRTAERAGLGSFRDEIRLLGTELSIARSEFDLGINEALKLMDAIFEGYRDFDSLLAATNISGDKLAYLLEGLKGFGHISIRNGRVEPRSRLYMNYVMAKTALV